MSGRAGRSGRPPKPIAFHLRDNTYRADRHQHLLDAAARATPASPPRVSTGLRRAALRGLSGTARRVVLSLLGTYGDWDMGAVEVLRNYGLSCARLEALQAAADMDPRHVHREVRIATLLLRSLDLEPRS